MKNPLLLFLIALTLYSCGNTSEKSIESILTQGDLKTIRATKNELANKQRSLQLNIAKLDSMIGVLEGVDKLPLN